MLVTDAGKGTISTEAGRLMFRVLYRDGKFDLVPDGPLAPIETVNTTSWLHLAALEYHALALVIEHQEDFT